MNEENIEAKQPRKRKFTKDRLVPGLVLTLALSFLLGLYAPLELYFTNITEFQFDFWTLLPPLLGLFGIFLLAGIVGFGLCWLVHDKLYDLALLIGGIGYVIAYVHGMFLVENLPPLDGTDFSWSDYHKETVISLIVCAVIVAVFLLLARLLHRKKMRKVITGISLFFTAILMVTVVTVGLTNDGFQKKPLMAVTKNAEFQMSSDRNLVIFLMDAVDSKAFRQLMDGDNPEYAETLSDFTYYPNTVGAYSFTEHSIPYILTGQWFENQEPFEDYTARAMAASPLLQKLRDENYRIGMYEEDLRCTEEQAAEFENVEKTTLRFTSFPAIAKEELKLVWFKYAPYALKRVVHVDMNRFTMIVEPNSDSELFHYVNWDFYPDAQNAHVTTVPDKVFKFIHIEGAHVPLRYDKDVNIIGSDKGTYDQNVQAAMTVLKQYLDNLKAAGVYDNTAIVVMADHGYWTYWDDKLLGRSNPLLAVKGVGESHKLSVSEAPISYEDLQECFSRLLDGTSFDQVFDAKEGDQRIRRYLSYNYLEEGHIVEFEQKGYATDLGTMVATGRVFDSKEWKESHGEDAKGK